MLDRRPPRRVGPDPAPRRNFITRTDATDAELAALRPRVRIDLAETVTHLMAANERGLDRLARRYPDPLSGPNRFALTNERREIAAHCDRLAPTNRVEPGTE